MAERFRGKHEPLRAVRPGERAPAPPRIPPLPPDYPHDERMTPSRWKRWVAAASVFLAACGAGAVYIGSGSDNEPVPATGPTLTGPVTPGETGPTGPTGLTGVETGPTGPTQPENPLEDLIKPTGDFLYLGTIKPEPGILSSTEVYRAFSIGNLLMSGILMENKLHLNDDGYMVAPMGVRDSKGNPIVIEIVFGKPQDDILAVAHMQRKTLINFVDDWKYLSYPDPLMTPSQLSEILRKGGQYPFALMTDFDLDRVDSGSIANNPEFWDRFESLYKTFKKDTSRLIKVLQTGKADNQKAPLTAFSAWILIPPKLQP